MDIFKSDHAVIHATQVRGYKLLNGVIRNISRDKILVTSLHAMVDTVDGKVKATAGDWILLINSGDLVVLSHIIFKNLYRKF